MNHWEYRQAPKYDWFVCLPRHPEHTSARDPRRAWQYNCCTGKHSAETFQGADIFLRNSGAELGDRIYYFESDHDMMMFSLKWQ